MSDWHSAVSFTSGFLVATALLSIASIVLSNWPIPYDAWKDFSGPVATIIASAAAAFFAYRLGRAQLDVARSQTDIAERNWQSTNQKLVMDIFERRIAIQRDIRVVVGSVMTKGKAGPDDLPAFLDAIRELDYYFGPDVSEYVERLRCIIIDMEFPEHNRKEHPIRIRQLREFYRGEGKDVFAPYIRAHMKVV